MTRLVVFTVFAVLCAWVLTFSDFKSITPKNNYNFEEAKTAYEKKQAEIELALNPPVVEKVEVVSKKHPGEIELATEELKLGYEIYHKAGKCVTCHGKYGQGKASQKAPVVASQHAWYLEKQLNEMKAGLRVNVKMNPYLKKLEAEDFKNVAIYMAALPQPE